MPQFLCLHWIFLFDCFYDFFLIKKKAIFFTQVSYTDTVLVAPIWNHPQETVLFFFSFSFWLFKNEKKKYLISVWITHVLTAA